MVASMDARPTLTFPQLGAVVAGNALEFYDFLTFGFFATQIGAVFFPLKDETSNLLATLAVFGVGFLTRPLGGLVIGSLGDRIGRKPAMLFSFTLMGVSIVGLALTPSFASIGWWAPALAVLFRLLQGLALGGETGPSTAFLMEAAPAHRRGLYVAMQFATQQFGTLCAGLAGLVLASILSPDDLTAWGWRIAMLLGAAVVPFALIMRKTLPETLETPSASWARPDRAQLWLALLAVMMLAAVTVATYTMNYMNTFGSHTLGLPPRLAFGAIVVTGSCGTLFNPVGGWLSDRLGRKPVMLAAFGLLCLVAVPCFWAMALLRSAAALYAGTALMAVLLALGTPSSLVALSESLPQRMRSGGIGLIYALAIASFGGTAQVVVTWLIRLTGSPLAPACYMAAALVLGLTGMALMRETAPVRSGASRN